MNHYILKEESFLKDTGSKVRVFEHKSTGAKVLTLDNDDTNNVFSIGFRTPPKDDTGVAHIVEHSTLSGSEKYKTKEPFMDLIQSSLQTFLNAMTFPDKTIYPVSSRNKKDFMNLMDVYLDAVFFPAIYENPKIFQQEGWHYEYEPETDRLKYNGVVFNEMKGVFSDPDSQVSYFIEKHLHPNSTYGNESGGLPSKIPELSYKNFLDFHRQYYHPSNSYIYLYGNFEKQELMDYIHENYLSRFEKIEPNSFPVTNPPFKERVYKEERYTTDKISSENTYYVYSTVLGRSEEGKDIMMRNIIADLLVEAEAAFLKEAFLKAGFGEDIYSQSSSSHPLDFSIVVKNAPAGRRKEFEDIIRSTIEKLVNDGIPRKFLTSVLKKAEFNLRRGDGPHQGIIFYIRALNSWLYDKSPLESLEFEQTFQELYDALDTDYYENYLKKYFLDNENTLILTVSGDTELERARRESERKRLNEKNNSLSDEEREKIIESEKALIKFQTEDDTREAKATIPKLKLSDVTPGVTHIPRREDTFGDHKVLIHPQFTNGISYFNFVFPLDAFSERELPVVTMVSDLVGRLSTENYSYEDLDTEIYLHTGGIALNPVVMEGKNGTFKTALVGTMGVLENETEKGIELLEELLTNTVFHEIRRIKDILFMSKSDMESNMLPSGHIIALERLKSHYNKSAYINEKLNGLDIYFYVKELLSDWENKKSDFVSDLEDVYKKLFTSQGLIVEFTGDEESYEKYRDILQNFVNRLPKGNSEPAEISFVPKAKAEGFYLPSQVQYVSAGFRYPEEIPYDGSMTVLANYLSTGYLHTEIRAKGGAYGAGIRIGKYGDIGTYSYRDPNLERTLKIYKSLGDYINNIRIDKEDLIPIIIGSMNAFDPLLTPEGKGKLDLRRYITGTTEEEVSEYKRQALNTEPEDLNSYGELISSVMNKNNIVIIGNRDNIENYDNPEMEIKSLLG